jgi:chromosome segregation ATPase
MARIGITYFDVEKAALQLQGQGKLPTVDRVRNLLGTGSKTTITEHLKRWKAEQADGQGKLPHELSALVTGLWERLQAQSELRINEVQSSCDEQIKSLQQALTQTQHLKQQLHEAVEDGLQKAHEKQAVEQQLQTEQQTHLQLEVRYSASQQQLEDLKANNAQLHQLAHQVQANLEHYQQAMQSQRAEQALEIEKREAGFQREIQELKQKVSLIQQKATTLQEENQHKTYALLQVKDTISTSQKQIDNLAQQYQQANQEVAKLTERCVHMEQSLHTEQAKAHQHKSRVKEREKQVILLTEQHQQLTIALHQAEDKVEALRHEKLFLVQEKAELATSLKQLQRHQVEV